jgi:sarcosine oxidase gamma subunit
MLVNRFRFRTSDCHFTIQKTLAQLELPMSNVSIQLDHLGVLPRLGLKGPEVARWLRDQSINVPADIYSTASIAGDAWIARLGTAEFLVEGDTDSDFIARLEPNLSPLPKGVFPVPRSDVTFVLSGPDARSVLAQTCGIDFRAAAPHRVIFSRVAGVSCGILPQPSGSATRYRLWLDPSYAPYLWETLAGIVTELGGVTHQHGSHSQAVHALS